MRIHSLCALSSQGPLSLEPTRAQQGCTVVTARAPSGVSTHSISLLVECLIVKATACHCVDCLSVLCSGKEEEVGRGHVGSEQPQGRPSVMEKQSKKRKKGGGGRCY